MISDLSENYGPIEYRPLHLLNIGKSDFSPSMASILNFHGNMKPSLCYKCDIECFSMTLGHRI